MKFNAIISLALKWYDFLELCFALIIKKVIEKWFMHAFVFDGCIIMKVGPITKCYLLYYNVLSFLTSLSLSLHIKKRKKKDNKHPSKWLSKLAFGKFRKKVFAKCLVSSKHFPLDPSFAKCSLCNYFSLGIFW